MLWHANGLAIGFGVDNDHAERFVASDDDFVPMVFCHLEWNSCPLFLRRLLESPVPPLGPISQHRCKAMEVPARNLQMKLRATD